MEESEKLSKIIAENLKKNNLSIIKGNSFKITKIIDDDKSQEENKDSQDD